MRYLHIFIFSIFLISCGGGGDSSVANNNISSSPSGAAPTGNFAGQVDPVQATD